MRAKAWYQSKTVWVNVAFIVATVITRLVLPADFVPEAWAGDALGVVEMAAGIVVMLVNIFLRFRTEQPIA